MNEHFFKWRPRQDSEGWFAIKMIGPKNAFSSKWVYKEYDEYMRDSKQTIEKLCARLNQKEEA